MAKKKEAPKHQTMWEDDRMAGFECDGENAGILHAGEWVVCGNCGGSIRLSWKVSILEKKEIR